MQTAHWQSRALWYHITFLHCCYPQALARALCTIVNLHKHKALYCQEANYQYIASAEQIYSEPSRCGHTLVTATGGLLDNVFDREKAAAGSVFRWDGDITQCQVDRGGFPLLLLAQGKLAKRVHCSLTGDKMG